MKLVFVYLRFPRAHSFGGKKDRAKKIVLERVFCFNCFEREREREREREGVGR